MTNTSLSENVHPLQAIERDKFTVACRQAAELIHRPEHGDRLTKAMDLVLGGSVTLHADGTATVKSGSHTYHLEPDCTCQDSQQRSEQAPEGACVRRRYVRCMGLAVLHDFRSY